MLLPFIIARQYFNEEPSYTEVNPGAAAVLTCSVAEKSRSSECIWQHDRLPVLLQAGKYEWAGQREAGDCSIRILRANIAYDDGTWECQVTSSSYQAGDGLSSNPIKLVVRQPPGEPRIYRDDGSFTSEGPISMPSGKEQVLRCESRGGNPAPTISWFIDNKEVKGDQRNETELGDSKRWTAVSNLVYTFSRDHNGKKIRCSIHHEALTRKVREQSLTLDIQYPPSVKLERSPDSKEVEDGVDSISLSCVADGNPKPDIVWRKLGKSSIFRVEEELSFKPVKKSDSGTYICLARNEIGASDEITATVDVKYPPTKVKTDPINFIDLEVGDDTLLTCEADGSPEPQFEWHQKIDSRPNSGDDNTVYIKGKGRVINLRNVTYDQEGLWRCSAFNEIKGKERKVHSEVLRIGVSGKPLPMALKLEERNGHSYMAPLGQEAVLSVAFCSDPPPRKLRWEWGSLKLDQGQSRGRFSVPELDPDKKKDCYSSKLHIDKAGSQDERTYYLVAENDRGVLRSGVRLTVRDPISMATVIGIAISGLLLIVLILLLIVFARRSRRCCFNDKGDYEPHDIRIERREEIAESDVERLSDGQTSSSQEQRTFPLMTGLGHEVTYQGHAGVGRPIPNPLGSLALYSAPRKTPQNVDRPGQGEDQPDLILPKKVRGTPTMYADLQFPKSSNFGSMKRKGRAEQIPPRHQIHPKDNTEYAKIKFNPKLSERAEL